jgi:hypothetical protein
MRVKIGPYLDWFGPHQIADAVFFWLDKHPTDEDAERTIYKLQDRLSDFLAGEKNNSWLMQFCQWVHDKQKRKVVVKLDYYDHWNAGHTMALVILPLLKALKEHKHGSPDVELGDVPERLWPPAQPNHNNNYTDDTVHERWAWVLDEMIWAFEQEVDDDSESQFYDHSESNDPNDDLMTQVGKLKVDREGLELHQERKANGFRLFGKYYQGLWD